MIRKKGIATPQNHLKQCLIGSLLSRETSLYQKTDKK